MSWQKQEIAEAFSIFMHLLKDGEINKQNEMDYVNYKKEEVQDILYEVIEPIANVKIFEAGDTLYMVPQLDNKLLNYSNKELKEKMRLPHNSALYLAHFFMLTLLAKFYNSTDLNTSTRQYVTLNEMEETIHHYMDEFRTFDDQHKEAYEEENGLDVEGMLLYWDELPSVSETAKDPKRGTSKLKFMYDVLRFLEEEHLIIIYEDVRTQIRLTKKTEMIVTKYYCNAQRKDQIMQLLSK